MYLGKVGLHRVVCFCRTWIFIFLLTTAHSNFALALDSMEHVGCAARRGFGVVEKFQVPKIPFDIFRLYMDDDGVFPNNPNYPLLMYKSAFSGSQLEGQKAITREGEWTSPWAWGIFTYHHYHSTAWELLLCVKGQANVQLGGDAGPQVTISKGDVVLIPPGFAHKQLESTGGFTLLGSYPINNNDVVVDTLTDVPNPQQRENISSCPLPDRDPIFGYDIASFLKS